MSLLLVPRSPRTRFRFLAALLLLAGIVPRGHGQPGTYPWLPFWTDRVQPANVAFYGTAGLTSANYYYDWNIRLTHEAQSQRGTMIVSRPAGIPDQRYTFFEAQTYFAMVYGNGADGMSFNYGPIADGNNGGGEYGSGNGLRIAMPVYSRAGNPGKIIVYYDNVELARRDISLWVPAPSGHWGFLQVKYGPDGLEVHGYMLWGWTVLQETAITNLVIPRWAPQRDWRFFWSARTGADTMRTLLYGPSISVSSSPPAFHSAPASFALEEDTPAGYDPGSFPLELYDFEDVASATLSATSSDPLLFPAGSVTFTEVSTNPPRRTVRVRLAPAPNRSGSATLTFTVTQAEQSATIAVPVTVRPVNDPPGLVIQDKATPEDTPLATSFVVTDIDSDLARVIVVPSDSSNPNLIALAGIVPSGSGGSRGLVLTPRPNQHGSSTLTLAVTDAEGLTSARSFTLTVTPVNDRPSADPRSGVLLATPDASVTAPSTGLGPGNPAHTVEAWVRPAGPGAAALPQRLLTLGPAAAGGEHWLLNPSTPETVELRVGIWDSSPQITGVHLPVGAWSHLATAWDGTHYTLFVNGSFRSQVTPSRPPSFTAPVPLAVGQRQDAGEENFAGQIDELRLWNRVLAEDEIFPQRARPLRGDESGLLLYWRFDEAQAGTAFDGAPAAGSGRGILGGGAAWASGLKREVYRDISGTLEALRSRPGFPGLPDESGFLMSSLEAPADAGDYYGQRVTGILVAPVTGDYQFWIASDEQSELLLSSDDQPAHAVRIAAVTDATGSREWEMSPGQRSTLIPLVAGGRYYLEVVMAESDGQDHLAVRWRLPDGRLEEPIPAARFEFLPDWNRIAVPEEAPTPIAIPGFDIELAQNEAGAEVRYAVLDSPRHGQLSLGGSSRWWFDVLTNLVYTPDPDFNGTDSFTYQLTDEAGATSAPATIFLEVKPANDPPILTLSVTRLNILEDESSPPIAFTITDADDDPDDPRYQYTVLIPESATRLFAPSGIVVTGTGEHRLLTLTPRPGEIGTATLEIKFSDPHGGRTSARLTVRVDPKPAYALVNLGTLSPQNQVFGTAVNDAGWAVGRAQSSAEHAADARAVLFRGLAGSGLLEDLGTPGAAGTTAEAFAINGANLVVGAASTTPGAAPQAFLWKATPTPLDAVASSLQSAAYAVNDDGAIAGFRSLSAGTRVAFYVDPDGVPTNLPTLGGTQMEALALNAGGQVVGYGRLADGTERAFAWKQGSPLRSLAPLPGFTDHRAYGINDDGIVVGVARSNATGGLVLRAFREESGVVTDLGGLPGGSNAVALAVNGFGQIVGEATDGRGRQRAWLRTAERNLDLNDLIHDSRTLRFAESGWSLHTARGISRNGTIVGSGNFAGRNAAFLAVPAWVIGRPIAQPEGAVDRKPEIELLDQGPTDTPESAFHWSLYERKLYALRPVTARLKWFVSDLDLIVEGTGTNTIATVITERIETLGIAVWPKEPVIHVATVPVAVEPGGVGFQYGFQEITFETTSGAALVDPTSKTFNSTATGYSVLYYLHTKGNPTPDPGSQSPYFDVIRTVPWDDPAHLRAGQASIGSRVTDPGHFDYSRRNGWVLNELAPYDGAGTDRAYDRPTRLGPIIPVNLDTDDPADDLVVVWYRTNRIGVAWGGQPVRYRLAWPSDHVVDRLFVASTLGSGELEPLLYPSARVYHQPDPTLPGYNPNEEHALILPSNTGAGQALFALRDDLNAVVTPHASLPYVLLKYRDPATGDWSHRVYRVLAEQATAANGTGPFVFRYGGIAGTEIQPPYPLSAFTLCPESHGTAGPHWEDYAGRLYARAAGAEGHTTTLRVRWFYPLQPGFFYDLDRDGTSDVPIGTSLAWLDRRPAGHLVAPNAAAGTGGTPLEVVYDIEWPRSPVLQIGETLMNPKRGLPAVKNMARLAIIYDDLDPSWDPATEAAPLDTLARLYDPLSTRILALGPKDELPASLARVNRDGKEIFPKLPYVLRSRLAYDPIRRTLEFRGLLDELSYAGEPLLLPNVLSSREAAELRNLTPEATWQALVDRLYHLTRNPNGVDLDPPDQQPDAALRLGLANEYTYTYRRPTTGTASGSPGSETVTVVTRQPPTTAERNLPGFTLTRTNVVTESFGSLPKALTAGLGGIPAAPLRPGRALAFDGLDDAVDGGDEVDLSARPFTVEFWARRTSAGERRVVFNLGTAEPRGRLAIGFGAQNQLFFEYDTSGAALVTPPYPDDLGQWVHWACVYDANTNHRAIFRNGQPVAQDSPAGSFAGTGSFFLGRDPGGAFFRGQLDDVRLWGLARTAYAIRQDLAKRLAGNEDGLIRYFRFDDDAETLVRDATEAGLDAVATGNPVHVASEAPTGMPPRYLTLVENNDPDLGALKVQLHVVRVDDGPFPGDVKPILPDNVFDERLTLRHSSDFGGDPDQVVFQWWYKPDGAGFDPEDLPVVNPDGTIADTRNWLIWDALAPPQRPGTGNDPNGTGWIGANQIVLGGAAQAGLAAISDNWFIVRYKGYSVGARGEEAWSDWIGDPSGTTRPRAALAEGWVKRVIRGLNPFDARVQDFHAAPVNTYASMLIQAGKRYEGAVAFNPAADNLNTLGLIEAYQTVLEAARKLSIEGSPPVNYNPANNALLLAASRIADLYLLLGNEAYADAQDPTIGIGTTDIQYGSAASSIFAFQNQLDSLLAEELALLRGRDDTFAGVGAPPVYNRLFWNFTLGEGEVAYQQVYNINDQNFDGFLDEKDARILYPQGHGDAWGHYLTAIGTYYHLLRHPRFTWIPRTERVNVAGVPQEVDFLDERKFARAAAARAATGQEIVNLTYREFYVEDPAGQWQGYKDPRQDRAWGVTEWARRAGQGAYFDWLAANAILPAVDPDPTHSGIRKIDRTTVGELAEIANTGRALQATMDEADRGLNPVGLAQGVVSFDLDSTFNEVGSVAQIGRRSVQGLTHFDQITERAVKALQNSIRVFDEANRATQNLRRTQDSIDDLSRNARHQELDFKNRLIEIFGYPYAGDIGPGKTYPSGYDGADLYKFMYVDAVEITGANSPPATTYTGFFRPVEITVGAYTLYSSDRGYGAGSVADPTTVETSILQVSYPTSAGDYGFEATPEMERRRAPGRLQQILGEMVQANAQLKIALQNYDGLMADLRDAILSLEEQEARIDSRLALKGTQFAGVVTANAAIGVMKSVEKNLRGVAGMMRDIVDATVEGMPKVVGLASDVTSPARAIAKSAARGSSYGMQRTADNLGLAGEVVGLAKEAMGVGIDLGIQVESGRIELFQAAKAVERLFRNEAALRLEAYNRAEAVRQIAGRYQAAVAEGLRLQDQLIRFRKELAASVTEARYQDMTFRIFRNDALQKYRAQFDLAARYTYLAATAYDYELNLLGDDPRAGGEFLAQIVRQRSLGQVTDGEPVVGQPGLADLLGRLIQNFDTVRGAFGFNNPQIEGNQFSLRHELFRIPDDDPAAADDPSDLHWRTLLRSRARTAGGSAQWVDDLWQIPEFRRFCRPFAPESAGAQPALVIRFPTSITFGRNFFGWGLAAGDSAYDPSRFATKAKSVGVWFGNYDASALARTPRVYLVPVGADVLRSPSQADDFATREWRVVDQVVPVPFPIAQSSLRDPTWLPEFDSLGGSFAALRRHASFRAFPDGEFDLTDPDTQATIAHDARLIGRSVWNTEWMLVIPGGTFGADPSASLERFIDTNTDIKILLQTYSYSGL
jgi:probable HAF family extracellular repeat protein